MTFFERVYEVARRIPRGKTASYGQIAKMIGAPGCARQVGYAMRACPADVPWHRVVKKDGSIAAVGIPALQRALLENEGVTFLPDERVNMQACQWDGEM